MPSNGVALAGFYGHGNFGDDVMAALFGRHLRSRQIPFRVSRLCAPYAEEFGLPVAHSTDQLLAGADTLIWGGGGLLVPWEAAAYERRFPGVAAECAQLVNTARERRLRIAVLSVGGGHVQTAPLVPQYKADLLDAAELITVRNRADLARVRSLGRNAEWFPDIVWQASSLAPAPGPRSPCRRPRIGIDLYAANLRHHHARPFLLLLQFAVLRHRSVEFVIFNSRNASIPDNHRLGSILRGPNVRRHRFHRAATDLAELASLDLLLTSRLHTAVVAMQYGVPCLSLFAEEKSRLLFSELGLADHVYTLRNSPRLLRLLARSNMVEQIRRTWSRPDCAALARESHGHLDRLDRFLS